MALVGCASDSTATEATSSGRPSGGPPDGGGGGGDPSVEVADSEIPEETAGPYPGDGSHGPDVLTESGIVRSDITSSFGSASGVAEGVPLTVRLKVYDLAGDEVTAMAGAAVYLWHCDRAGSCSMYDGDAEGENYLRGVHDAAAGGKVEFVTIFPAAYSGRWPHMHLEVYESLDKATSASTTMRTSQLALPQEQRDEVYATEGYEASVAHMAQTSLNSDQVFSDGHTLQLATVTGSVAEGYVATLNVPV